MTMGSRLRSWTDSTMKGDTAHVSPETGEQNIELLKSMRDLVRQGGIGAIRTALEEGADFDDAGSRLPEGFRPLWDLIDPEIELDSLIETPGPAGTRFRGREQWFAFWRDFLEPWEEYDFEYSNFEAVGDHVVVDIRVNARGRGSGVPVEWLTTQVWTFRDGKVVRLGIYDTRQAADDAVVGER
jgi:ketosteroid isomerase-like protein